jgi:(R)-2-hydroxyacyl-CoA dehydratese activating ATPase
MFSIGCDVGTMFTKTVIMEDETVIAHDITRNAGNLHEVVEASLQKALAMAGVHSSDIAACGGTGMGDKYITSEHTGQGIIKCLAKGSRWALPGVRTVVDLGGLSTSIISLDDSGKVLEYRTSDKCATGSGFFLELAAHALEMSIEDMGQIMLPPGERAHMSTQCAVFCESEIVSHVNDGIEVNSIVAGINASLGSGIATLIKRLGPRQEILVTGGVAKSRGVVLALEEHLGMEVMKRATTDQQLIGAVGAALCAREGLS